MADKGITYVFCKADGLQVTGCLDELESCLWVLNCVGSLAHSMKKIFKNRDQEFGIHSMVTFVSRLHAFRRLPRVVKTRSA